jgi:hypothetical protein
VAERLSRRALVELAEVTKAERWRGTILRVLGASLIAQRRYAEAEPLLVEALAIARKRKLRVDDLQVYELPLAQAEAGVGKRGDAIARARAIRDALARFPAQPRTRREAAALLARIDPDERAARRGP